MFIITHQRSAQPANKHIAHFWPRLHSSQARNGRNIPSNNWIASYSIKQRIYMQLNAPHNIIDFILKGLHSRFHPLALSLSFLCMTNKMAVWYPRSHLQDRMRRPLRWFDNFMRFEKCWQQSGPVKCWKKIAFCRPKVCWFDLWVACTFLKNLKENTCKMYYLKVKWTWVGLVMTFHGLFLSCISLCFPPRWKPC